MIVLSKQLERQPFSEIPVQDLFRRAIRVSETFRLPFPGAVYCSNCGTYQRERAFPRNRAKGQGFDHWCRTCHQEYDRKRYAEKVFELEGREVKNYKRRQLKAA